MRKITLMIAAMAILTVVSCKKDDDSNSGGNTTPTKTKTDLLTAKSWTMTAGTLNPGIVIVPGIPPITDFYALMEACTKDDFTKFNTGGKGVNDEGASKCDPADPQSTNFDWAFTSSESKLIYDGDTFNLASLNETNMQLTADIDASEFGGTAGQTVKMTVTFKNN